MTINRRDLVSIPTPNANLLWRNLHVRDKELLHETRLTEMMWQRREIENYFCLKEVLTGYAISDFEDDIFGHAEKEKRLQIMDDVFNEVSDALGTLGKGSP